MSFAVLPMCGSFGKVAAMHNSVLVMGAHEVSHSMIDLLKSSQEALPGLIAVFNGGDCQCKPDTSDESAL